MDFALLERIYHSSDCLFTLEEMDLAMQRLAQEVNNSGLDPENLVVLCVMNGGLVPAGRVVPYLELPFRMDYLHASRYRGKISGAELQWVKRHEVSLQDQDVLIIDDILDEGITLQAIVDHCYQEGAKCIKTLVAVEKQCVKKREIKADFVGHQVPDRYVFGFGMDYKGYLRNAPGVYALNETKKEGF